MKGSRQNPFACLSWWPYYLPLWTLVVTPLAACSSNFLFCCLQASHNSSPSQVGSLSFHPVPVFLVRHCCSSNSSSHPALSPWPRLQGPWHCCFWVYPFIRSLAAFLHKRRKTFFFSVLPPMPWLERHLTGLRCSTCPLLICLLVVKVRWKPWGVESLFRCALRSLRGTQAMREEF